MQFIAPILKELGYLDNLFFNVAVVGSRKLNNEGDVSQELIQTLAPNLAIYGFDADPDACESANSEIQAKVARGEINWYEEHFPTPLADSSRTADLFVTRDLACCSLYEPNLDYARWFEVIPEAMTIDLVLPVDVFSLDDFCHEKGLTSIDYLMLDVQGAELLVLQGASGILPSVLAIKTEVNFSNLYHRQPLFADVDIFLRQAGFSIFDLSCNYIPRKLKSSPRVYSKRFSKFAFENESVRCGQLLWGDAIYFRDLLHCGETCQEKLLKLACLADLIGFTEYAYQVVECLDLGDVLELAQAKVQQSTGN
jgi:FkbM family methyltransferase